MLCPYFKNRISKTSIHPKFKMSWWKLPRILLNTKIMIIPSSGLLFYQRKSGKSSKNHQEKQFHTEWKQAYFFFLCSLFWLMTSPLSLFNQICFLVFAATQLDLISQLLSQWAVTCDRVPANEMRVEEHKIQPPPLLQLGPKRIFPSSWIEEKRSSGKLGKLPVDCGGFKNTCANSLEYSPLLDWLLWRKTLKQSHREIHMERNQYGSSSPSQASRWLQLQLIYDYNLMRSPAPERFG